MVTTRFALQILLHPKIRAFGLETTARPSYPSVRFFFPIIITEASASYHRSLFQKVYEFGGGGGELKMFSPVVKKKVNKNV